MNKKCNQYESLFTFREESELKEHIKNCPDCKEEQAKMDKISSLIQEVKPYYIQKRIASFSRMKVACILCFGLFIGLMLGYFAQYAGNSTRYYTSDSTNSLQTTNEYGIPVDTYGLITVN